MTSFSFYFNRYYFGVNLNHHNNTSVISGTYYPEVNVINDNPTNIKKFEKSFNKIINITPQNAAQKVKLYMTFS
jgi:hypothetical protein